MEGLQRLILLFTSAQWIDVTAAVLVFLLFLFLRKIFTLYIFKIILKLSHRSSTDLDDVFLLAFKAPLSTLFIILGLYFALTILPLTPAQNILLFKILRVVLILLVTWGLYNLAGTYLSEESAKKLNFKIDRILVPFFSKVIKVIIIVLALSIIAQEWGYEISGLIAGLGLGGLAVALAAQDALATFSAGS